MNTENNLEKLKTAMHDGLIFNYEKNGYLAPAMFFLKTNGDLMLRLIPSFFLSHIEGKKLISSFIRNMCSSSDIIAAGMVIEAYAKTYNVNENIAERELVELGKIRLSDSRIENKLDVIVLTVSTPEKTEVLTYPVDVKNKKVLVNEIQKDNNNQSGIFVDCFVWEKHQ